MGLVRPRATSAESEGELCFGGKIFAASLETVLTNLADNPLPGFTADRSIGDRAPPHADGKTDVAGAGALARDLDVGRRVLRAEITGLERLARALDGAFERALDLCAAARGRLIVTGIGKSGHVARKIAATLASTENRRSSFIRRRPATATSA